MNEQAIIDCAIRCEHSLKLASNAVTTRAADYWRGRAALDSAEAFAFANAHQRRTFCVIGQCLNARGQWTSFVLNSVPATSARGAAHAAVADMERRGASNVQPHKVTETTP